MLLMQIEQHVTYFVRIIFKKKRALLVTLIFNLKKKLDWEDSHELFSCDF